MKILNLTFQNLNSIAGDPVHLDFEGGALAEAGIFAITGPTGAGKTTILDAITLALFGKAARYDEHTRAVPENMMSRGAGSCFSEVRFAAGGGIYTARWDLWRSRKKAAGKIQPPKRQLADDAGTLLETKLKAVDERITEITGMDYNRFLRSVLLAQGRFREFLDAGEKERGDLLERITGTEIYSQLSKLAFEAAKEKDEALAEARQAVAMLVLLSDEEKAGFAAEQKELTAQKEALQSDLSALSGRLTLHTQWQNGLAEKTRFEKESQELTQAGEALAPDQARLNRHEKAAPMESALRLWESACTAIKGLETDEAHLKTERNRAEAAAADAFYQAQEACTRQLKENETRIAKGHERQKKLEATLTKAKAWQREHAMDEQLEAALPGLRAKARDAGQQAERVQGALKAENLTQQEITGKQAALSLATTALLEAETACATAEERVKALEQELAPLPPAAALIRQKEALDARQRGISELKQIALGHATGMTAVTALEKEQKEKRALKAALAKENDEAATARALAQQTLADKEALHQQALLIESLADKRAHLVEGEPCPLCGALAHPYATGTGEGSSRTYEAQRDQAKERLRACEAAEKALGQRLAREEAGLSATAASLKMKSEEVQGLFQRYDARLKDVGARVPIEDAKGLDTLGAEVGAQLTSLGETLKKVEALEQDRTKAEKKLLTTQGDTATQRAKTQQLRQDTDRLNGQLKGQRASREALEAALTIALEAACRDLSAWNITPPKTPDPAAITEAISTLDARAAAWTETVKRIFRETAELERVYAGIDALTVQINQLREEKSRWEEKGEPFDAHKGALGPAPSAPLSPEARRELCEQALARVAGITTQLATAKRQLEARRSDEEARQKALTHALTQAGFPDIPALRQALLAPKTRADITTRIEAHKEQRARLSALRKENEATLEKLLREQPPTEEEALALTGDKKAKELTRDELLKQMGQIDQKLKADADARRRQATQLEQIDALEKEARPWLLLKDLIGSADGTKFSRFAQGLTLGQLVLLANRHLVTLNPRYAIRRVPTEDLGLEIVDRYQADAVRPTQSLSGGESFLVSLALALGLSEMAGQKTRIESLFIDEGFGSLDAETLDTALAALDNLRLANRTIGIISHVELLKNRIGAQIEVTRTPDGHATLKLVDG